MSDTLQENTEAKRRKDLAEFLKAKRACLKPSDVGLPSFGRRRAPGLRREELAQISGIGLSWYTFLEQGRDIKVSRELLQRLTTALRLTPHDAAYLTSLAAHEALEVDDPFPQLLPMLQCALDGFTAGPAFVTDEAFDVLAFNHVGDFIYHFDGFIGSHVRNIAWRLFMDPYRRGIFEAWPEWAAHSVGILRAQSTRLSGNKKLNQLVNDLLAASPEFEQMWNESRKSGAGSYLPNVIVFQIAGFGKLRFFSLRLKIITNPDWLFVQLVPADDQTADVVREIRSRSCSEEVHCPS